MQIIKLLLLCMYFLIPHNLFIGINYLSGIKPSDIISVIVLFTLLNKKNTAIPFQFLLLPMWYLIRSVFSIQDLGFISLAFGSKFIEYIIIIYSIASLSKKQNILLMHSISISTMAFILLEYLGIFWGQDWAGRYSGQYGGPYELGAIALLLFYVYRNYIIKSFYLILIVLSSSKASILGLIYSFIPTSKISFSKLIVMLTIIGVALINERVQSLLGSAIVFIDSNILEMISSVPYSSSNLEYFNNWLLREEYSQYYGLDWSTGSRIYTYILAIKSLDFLGIIFGMGPGYFGYAIDSSILRIFVESGIIGLILFIIYYQKIFIYEKSTSIRKAILINLLLVDVLFSARFFPILFLCYILNFNIKDDL